MKYSKALLAALVAGAATQDVSEFCDDQSDPNSCNANLVAMSDETSFCFENHGGDVSLCLEDVLRLAGDGEDQSNFATQEEVMDEFVTNIAEDPMLQNVLAELNSIRNFIDGLERSAGENGTAPSEEALQQAGDQEESLRRFVELKQLVSWMQPKDKRISRYCFYGCWCLPEGAHSFVSGEGRPVDLVDKACQYLWFCYVCAKQEFRGSFGSPPVTKECLPDKRKYAFRFKYESGYKTDYSKRDIVCKDNWYSPMDSKAKWKSNCARAICECDRGLAMRLYRSWKHWDKSRHRIWSQKVTTCPQLTACKALPEDTASEKAIKGACMKRGCLFIVKLRCLNGVNGGPIDHQEICCGLYGEDGSRFEMRDHGGTHDCCAHNEGAGSGLEWDGNWYNTITHCCADGSVLAAGNPGCGA